MSECLSHQELEEAVRLGEASLKSANREHVQSCPSCRCELDEVRANLGFFNRCAQIGSRLATEASDPDRPFPPPSADAADGPVNAPTIDGYETLEEIHRGAQGVVYKAVQESTNRTVALKLLLQGPYATRRQRRRFEREIELVGTLEHPNIVHLYDSGQSEGRHYFVMQYVDGLPLRDYVSANRLAVSETLRLFVKVTRAVAYAHQRGIIHRDLKPGNILVDADGEPHVLDFGLAKTADPAQAASDTLATQAGEFFGTLAYASPEQVSGKPGSVDTRTDVYALGLILYELLTDRSPYSTGGSVSQALKSITETEPRRPSHYKRKLDDDIDTIVLKAIAKDPERRYASANALAADIERYFAGLPIEAKSDSNWYLLRKNLIRHKVAVAVASAFVVVISLALAVSLSQWQVARQNAKAAERNFAKARDAVDLMLTEVGENSLANVPQMEQVRRSLLEKALTFYQGFIDENSTDLRVRFETGRAYMRVALITGKLGQLERSQQAYKQAISLFEALLTDFPHVPDYASALAKCHRFLAAHLELPGRGQENRKALALAQKLVADFPGVPEYRGELAVDYSDLGNYLDGNRQFDQAEKAHRKAIALLQPLAAESPKYRDALAGGHLCLGTLLEKVGRNQEAEEHLREALALRQELLTDIRTSAYHRGNLRHVLIYLGKLLVRTGRCDQAVSVLRQAESHGKQLTHDFPNTFSYHKHLALTCEELGQALLAAGRYSEAVNVTEDFLRLRYEAVEKFPETVHDPLTLAWPHYDLGIALHKADRRDQAAEHFTKAFPLFEKSLAKYPKNRKSAEHLAWVLTTCPDSRFHDGPRAVAMITQALRNNPNRPPELYQLLGMGHYRAEHYQAAIDALNQAPQDGETWFFLAMAHAQLGRKDDARQYYDKAVQWMTRNRPGDLTLLAFRTEAAEVLGQNN